MSLIGPADFNAKNVKYNIHLLHVHVHQVCRVDKLTIILEM